MIDEKSIFNEIRNNISMMCCDDCVGADLASAAGIAMTNKMRSVCVSPKQIVDVWPWLEKTNIKIISRFVVDRAINDEFVSELAGEISASFRDGANGAIVFIQKRNLAKFAAEIASIREDLFFNKSFSIGMDIEDIDVFDWDELFGILHLMRANSLTLTYTNDAGDKSDFVGRVYAMLNTTRGEWNGIINFVLGHNFIRIDQSYRLIQQIQPETLSKTEFFVDN